MRVTPRPPRDAGGDRSCAEPVVDPDHGEPAAHEPSIALRAVSRRGPSRSRRSSARRSRGTARGRRRRSRARRPCRRRRRRSRHARDPAARREPVQRRRRRRPRGRRPRPRAARHGSAPRAGPARPTSRRTPSHTSPRGSGDAAAPRRSARARPPRLRHDRADRCARRRVGSRDEHAPGAASRSAVDDRRHLGRRLALARAPPPARPDGARDGVDPGEPEVAVRQPAKAARARRRGSYSPADSLEQVSSSSRSPATGDSKVGAWEPTAAVGDVGRTAASPARGRGSAARRGPFHRRPRPRRERRHAAVLRSQFAHARITGSTRRRHSSSRASSACSPARTSRSRGRSRRRRLAVPYYAAAVDTARYVGEPLAVVVARDRYSPRTRSS